MVDEVMHWHHILPRHAGGSNSPSNLVQLTVAEHAEAHRILYEMHGRWQDKVAWRFLSGQISSAQANLEANRLRNKGVPKTEKHKENLSRARLGFKASDATREAIRRGHLGLRHTEETKQKIRAANKGKKMPAEAIQKYVQSRQTTDGTPVTWRGQVYPTQSQAARAMARDLGISFEAARCRARRMASE